MIDRQQIVHMYRNGDKSIRAIARETGFNRKTVMKVVKEYEDTQKAEKPYEALEEMLTVSPKYDVSHRTSRVLTQEMKDKIDWCLRQNKSKEGGSKRKQKMRCTDIHDHLRSLGYGVSYQTVCRYVKQKSDAGKSKEAFMRLHYEPGENVEFDWGETTLTIDGKDTRFYIAVFTFCYSNLRYAYLFRHQNTLAFMESHRNFFRDVHGVPARMVYDNMRVAISEFIYTDKGTEKVPTEALTRMAAFYNFQWRFCNIRSGWEKGHVERSVDFVRDKAFCMTDAFPSIAEAQEHLDATCKRINAEPGSQYTEDKAERGAMDLGSLRKYPGEIGCFESEERKVDKWSTISMGSVHYSVPDTLVGCKVRVKKYSERIRIYDGTRMVATHERSDGLNKWIISIDHYLRTLSRKSSALTNCEAWYNAPDGIKRLYNRHFKNQERDFVIMLKWAQDNGNSQSDVINAASALEKNGVTKVSAEQVKAMLLNKETSTEEHTSADSSNSVYLVQMRQIEQRTDDELDALTGMLNSSPHPAFPVQ